jgi:pimeloyl-ACP methyl ester carboxylesterase
MSFSIGIMRSAAVMLVWATAASSQAPSVSTARAVPRTIVAPPPTGPYAVGRRFEVWTDSARRDPVDSTRSREVLVWIWYPAEGSPNTEDQPVLPPEWRARRIAALAAKLGPDVARAAGSLRVHARTEAAFARDARRLPALLFTPGLGWLASDYSVMLEDLASHGYVVAGIASPGFADVVRFPDGREVARTLGIGEKIGTDQVYVQADAAFALRRLRALADDPTSFLHGRVDLSRIGAFGHSLGGTTAFVLAARDAGVRAAVNVDGDPMGDVVAVRPTQPLLLVSSESPTIAEAPSGKSARFLELTRQGLERSEQRRTNDWLGIASSAREACRARIIGTHHLDFEDAALFSSLLVTPEQRWMRVGAIDGARGLAVTTELVRVFFDRTLGSGRDGPSFVAAAARLPEVRVESSARGADER